MHILMRIVHCLILKKQIVQDLNAAKILKGDMKEIGRYVSGKVGKKNYNALNRGMYSCLISHLKIFLESLEK